MTMAAGCLVLMGWMFDISVLKSIMPGLAEMKIRTAVPLILAGFSMWWLTAETRHAKMTGVATVCAVLVTGAGLLSLSEYAAGRSFPVEDWLLHATFLRDTPFSPLRVSFMTACNLVFVGASLLLLHVGRSPRASAWLLLPVAALSGLALIGHILEEPALFFGIPELRSAGMALYTAVTFLILSAGILLAHPERGMVAVVTADSAGGVMARRLLPAAIVIPVLLAWLRLEGQVHGLYGTALGIAMLTTVIVAVFAGLITWNALALHRLDIARRSAEESLQESRDRLDLALVSARIGTWVWNMETDVSSSDAYLPRLFGLTTETYIGGLKNFQQIVHPDDWLQLSEALTRCTQTGDELDDEFRVVWPDGSVRFLVSRGKVYPDAEGRPVHMAGVCLDVTDRKQAELALKVTAAALERSNKELEIFAYVASHDLQEPVRAVSGCVELLQRRCQGQLDEGARELMKHIVEGATRMRTLINDLLTYSRVSTKGRPFEPVSCEDVFQTTLANLAVAVTESVALVTHDPLPEIVADRTQMGQLLLNLIGNAIKYRGEQAPFVHVGARREGDAWLFSVSDNGIGIEPQYFERIFVLFQRLHSRGKYSGTGIGLALCKKIVERHGGRIWVESAAGKGSTFYFTIPHAKGSALP